MPALSIGIVDSAPRSIAYMRRQASLQNVAAVAAASPLWGTLYGRGLVTTSTPIVVFWDDGGEAMFDGSGVPVDIAAEVATPFESDAILSYGHTPAGRTATCRYGGPYEQAPDVHRAIRAWCNKHGHAMAGPVWEVYRWNEDPTLLVTDVFYLLK